MRRFWPPCYATLAQILGRVIVFVWLALVVGAVGVVASATPHLEPIQRGDRAQTPQRAGRRGRSPSESVLIAKNSKIVRFLIGENSKMV